MFNPFLLYSIPLAQSLIGAHGGYEMLKVYVGVVRFPDDRDFVIMVDGEPGPVEDSVRQVIEEIWGEGEIICARFNRTARRACKEAMVKLGQRWRGSVARPPPGPA